MQEMKIETKKLLQTMSLNPKRRVTEPDYARFRDSTFTFQFGFEFECSIANFYLRMFLGMYECTSGYFAQFILVNRYPPPADRNEEKRFEFFNEENVTDVGMWLLNPQEEVRFYSGGFVSKSNFKKAIELMTKSVAQKAKNALSHFLAGVKDDSLYREQKRLLQEEIEYCRAAAPTSLIQPSSANWLYYEALEYLFAREAQRIKHIEAYGRVRFTFKLKNDKEKDNGLPLRLPLNLQLGPGFAAVKMYIYSGEQVKVYSNPEELRYMLRVIAKVNSALEVGHFDFEEQHKRVSLNVKSAFFLLDRTQWRILVQQTVESCLLTYVQTVADILQRVDDCMMMGISEADEEFSHEASDLAEESETYDSIEDYFDWENSDFSSTTTTIPERRGYINQLDLEKAAILSQTLPEEAKHHFCLSQHQLQSKSLLPWTEDDRLSEEKVILQLVATFTTLRNMGVTFTTLPLSSCAFSWEAVAVIVPTFPEADMRVDAPNTFDEAQFASEVSQQLVQYMLRYCSEKQWTLAHMGVTHSLASPSKITQSRLKFQKLKTAFVDKGGFGKVYLNYMGSTPVALKVLDSSCTEKRKRAFSRELRYQMACPHHSIVRAYGYLEAEGELILVSEYCSGGNLKKFLKENSLSMQQRVQMMREVAEGVAFMHGKNICHFDLKPGNVLVSNDGRPKICDFGLARLVDNLDGVRRTGCTLRYSAPEQNLPGERCGKPADVWGFGQVAYFILFGKSAFSSQLDTRDKVAFAREALPKALETLIFQAPFPRNFPVLVGLIRSCLQYEAVKRPTILSLLEKLRIEEQNVRD